MNDCVTTCLTQNVQPATCNAVCSCTVDRLRQGELWRKVISGALTEDDRNQLSRTAQQCLRRSPL